MKKNTFLLFLVLLIAQANLYAQLIPDNNRFMPKTPEAYRYEQMGDLAVNPSTGVPNINIPLYKISLKSFGWNISLDYRAKGFKVDEVSGSVGLGWNLNSTGIISQSINSASDVLYPLEEADINRDLDLLGYSSGHNVYYSNYNDVSLANSSINTNTKNLQPDLFSMNIGELNYKFFLKEELEGNQPVTRGYTMPASNIKISFQRFSSSTVLDSAKFEIVDEKGNTYYLKNRGANTSLDYCDAMKIKSQGLAYVFYLDRIKNLNGDEIRFYYKEPNSYTYITSITQTYSSKDNLFPCNYYPDVPPVLCEPRFVAIEPLLDSVWVSNGNSMKFSYGVRLDLVDRQGNNVNSALKKIKIYSERVLTRSISFDQDYFLSSTTPNVDDRRLKLERLSIMDADENPNTKQEYLFQYNATPLPNRLSFDQDSLGYHNFPYNNTVLIPRLSERGRLLYGTKASVLERIYYPTKGYTNFTYGLSDLADGGLVVTEILDNDGNNNTRRRSFSYKEPRGQLNESWIGIDHVFFKFVNNNGNDDFNSCIVTSENSRGQVHDIDSRLNKPDPYFGEITEYFDINGDGGKIVYKYDWQPTFGISFMPVELREKVTFAKENGVFVPLKKEEFSYLVKNPFSVMSYYEEPTNVKEKRVTGKQIWRTAPEIKGLMTADGNPVEKSLTYRFSVLNFMFRSLPYYQTQKKVTEYEASVPRLVTEETSFFDNDIHGMPTRITQTNSEGVSEGKFITYPNDYANGTGFVDDMVISNLVSSPIETVNYKQISGSDYIVSANVNTFKGGGKGLVDKIFELKINSPIPVSTFKFSNSYLGATLPIDTRQTFTSDSHYVLKESFDLYDEYGNPLQRTNKDAISTSYLWAYKGQYPIAEIKNATYSQILALIPGGNIGVTNFRNTLPDKIAIDNFLYPLKTSLPNSLFTSFVFHRRVGMTSQTDTKGMTSYYEYDSFQRLLNIKDHFGNIVKNFKYHLKDQITSDVFYNVAISSIFTKNNCAPGYIGGSITYYIPANVYSSSVSQAAADAMAAADVIANGQAYANANSVCTLAPICTQFKITIPVSVSDGLYVNYKICGNANQESTPLSNLPIQYTPDGKILLYLCTDGVAQVPTLQDGPSGTPRNIRGVVIENLGNCL